MEKRTIETFMRLVTDKKGKKGQESRSDRYYRSVYEKYLDGRRLRWNWGAAFSFNLWTSYRKMYVGTLLYYALFGTLTFLYCSHKIGGIVFGALSFIKFLLCGFLGNRWYIRHIHKKIDKNYHEVVGLKNTDNVTALIVVLIFLMTCIVDGTYAPSFMKPIQDFLKRMNMGDSLFLILLISIVIHVLADRVHVKLYQKKVQAKVQE